ncbi:hypothetical protein [Sporomusa silvacetica]
MSIAPHSRAEGLIARLLSECKDISLCREIMVDLVAECQELDFIRGVLGTFKELGNSSGVNLDEIKGLFAQRLDSIIDSRDNVFIPPEQFRDFWALLDNCSHERVATYLHDLLADNIDTLPDFMNLMVSKSMSSSTGIRYEFSMGEYKHYEPLISVEELHKAVNEYIAKHSKDTLPKSIYLYLEVVEKLNQGIVE